MIAFSDVLKIFDSTEKWRGLAALPKQFAALTTRVEELERKLGQQRDPLACKECGASPVRIETKEWVSISQKKMQTVRRICPACGRIDGRDEQIGNG